MWVIPSAFVRALAIVAEVERIRRSVLVAGLGLKFGFAEVLRRLHLGLSAFLEGTQ
jgi:hypothetical protein